MLVNMKRRDGAPVATGSRLHERGKHVAVAGQLEAADELIDEFVGVAEEPLAAADGQVNKPVEADVHRGLTAVLLVLLEVVQMVVISPDRCARGQRRRSYTGVDWAIICGRRHRAARSQSAGIVRIRIDPGQAVYLVTAHAQRLIEDIGELVGIPMMVEPLVIDLKRVVVGPAGPRVPLEAAKGSLIVRTGGCCGVGVLQRRADD